MLTKQARYRLIAAVAMLNTAGAGLGAVGLASGFLDLGPGVTARLPWGSVVLGGVALGLLVALPNALLGILAFGRNPWCGPASIASGAVLVGWILVELAFIRELSFFHPLYVAVGLLQVRLGGRINERAERAPALGAGAEFAATGRPPRGAVKRP